MSTGQSSQTGQVFVFVWNVMSSSIIHRWHLGSAANLTLVYIALPQDVDCHTAFSGAECALHLFPGRETSIILP